MGRDTQVVGDIQNVIYEASKIIRNKVVGGGGGGGGDYGKLVVTWWWW